LFVWKNIVTFRCKLGVIIVGLCDFSDSIGRMEFRIVLITVHFFAISNVHISVTFKNSVFEGLDYELLFFSQCVCAVFPVGQGHFLITFPKLKCNTGDESI